MFEVVFLSKTMCVALKITFVQYVFEDWLAR